MLWYICLIIAIVLLVIAIKNLIKKEKGKMRVGISFLLILLMSYIIYIPAFLVEYDFVGAIIGTLLHCMQIISLDAGYLDFYDIVKMGVDNAIIFKVYIVILGVVHFVLPIVFAFTAYTFLVYCMSNVKLFFLKVYNNDIFIFSDLNEKTVELAKDIKRIKKRKARFIFANTISEKNEYSLILDKINCIFYPNEIYDLKLRIKRGNVFFFNISDNGDKNLNEALELINKYNKKSKETQKKISIYITSNNDNMEKIIDSVDKGLLKISIINESLRAVYKLVDEHFPYKNIVNNTLSILIVGLNNLGEEVLKTMVWTSKIQSINTKINIIDKSADEKEREIKFKYPELLTGEYNISFYKADIETIDLEEIIKENCRDSNYIVVCDESDERNIATSMFLRRFYLMLDPNFMNQPFIASYIKSSEKTEMVKKLRTAELKVDKRESYNIVPFGAIHEIYTYKQIIDRDIDKIAFNIHMTYEEIFNEEKELDINGALERYNLFEVNKASNVANALHIRYKLWELGLDYTDEKNVVEVDFRDYLTDDILEKLTILEHDRWMAFLRTKGWITATVEQARQYQKSGISKGRHNCALLQMHPYICEFDKLKWTSEQLGLPDSTVYDRELIRRIPNILKDKWNVTGKKYKIVELEKGRK